MESNTKTKAIALLGHQGTPSLKEVTSFAHDSGFELVVLTSKPSMDSLIKPAQEVAHLVHIVDQNSLTLDDVKAFEALLCERNIELVAAVATWEGYRPLMSYLNNQVNAADCSVDAIETCLDKHKMRKMLVAKGLSESKVEVLDLNQLVGNVDAVFAEHQGKFIKPRSGAAAFACFRLTEKSQLEQLQTFRSEMINDPVMSSIFCDNFDFLVEEYIPGIEFSVEIVVLDNHVYTLCIHEKYGLDHKAFTILESVVVSPPVSVDSEIQDDLVRHITNCAAAIGISNGVFHVEIKYDMDTHVAEIIEFNPRIGGFLISDSVKAHTENKCLVNMWLASLTYQGATRDEMKLRLEHISHNVLCPTNSTVQISQFGDRGQTIAEIGMQSCSPEPSVTKYYVQAGSKLSEAEREIPIFDAMWTFDHLIGADKIDAIVGLANDNFKLQYEV